MEGEGFLEVAARRHKIGSQMVNSSERGWIPRVRGSCFRKIYIWGLSSRGERKNRASRLLRTGLLTRRALTDSLPG